MLSVASIFILWARAVLCGPYRTQDQSSGPQAAQLDPHVLFLSRYRAPQRDESPPENTPTKQIINGASALPGEFPYFGLLLVQDHGLCGCSLISRNWALTAAHCFELGIRGRIFFGSLEAGPKKGRLSVRTKRFVKHPQYDEVSLKNDIGLIELSRRVQYSSTINPIRLASKSLKIQPGASAIVCGFGLTVDKGTEHSRTLQYIRTKLTSREECQQIYGADIVTENTLCTHTSEGSVCTGDSGGPLVIMNGNREVVVAGVVSFTSDVSCLTHATGYTRVSSYTDWITSVTGIVA